MSQYKTQYNNQNNQYSGSNTYPKKTWNNPRTSNDSNGGFAQFISTKKDGCIFLQAESQTYQYPSIKISEDIDFEIWGVVTHTIHKNR